MAHIHDKIDFCVEVFIVYNNRVLLRMHDKYKIWLSVGGHIELHEDPNEAALREVKEEVGLDVQLWDTRQHPESTDEFFSELIPPISMGRHTAIHPHHKGHEHIPLVYIARATTDAVTVSYEGDRSDEWRWFSKEELKSADLRKNVRTYADLALDTLAGQ